MGNSQNRQRGWDQKHHNRYDHQYNDDNRQHKRNRHERDRQDHWGLQDQYWNQQPRQDPWTFQNHRERWNHQERPGQLLGLNTYDQQRNPASTNHPVRLWNSNNQKTPAPEYYRDNLDSLEQWDDLDRVKHWNNSEDADNRRNLFEKDLRRVPKRDYTQKRQDTPDPRDRAAYTSTDWIRGNQSQDFDRYNRADQYYFLDREEQVKPRNNYEDDWTTHDRHRNYKDNRDQYSRLNELERQDYRASRNKLDQQHTRDYYGR